VGSRAGIYGCGKYHPNRDSIPGPSNPYRVATTTFTGLNELHKIKAACGYE